MLLTDRQKNRQTRATDNDENITFAMAEVIIKSENVSELYVTTDTISCGSQIKDFAGVRVNHVGLNNVSPSIYAACRARFVKWLHESCTHYWPFESGIHRSPVDSPLQGPIMWSFNVFAVSLNKLWSKQSSYPWLEMVRRSHNVTLMCKSSSISTVPNKMPAPLWACFFQYAPAIMSPVAHSLNDE